MGETPSLIPFDRLPLGFRFHPTDEELINHYLKHKIDGQIRAADAAVIPEIDVCKFEPWDLPERSPIRSADPEWFFFAAVDRKYPSGNRSNRATVAGYWKATGKDRMIRSRGRDGAQVLVGMKKTLVFHQGRAPKGVRTNWIMHEYRTVEPEFECGDQGGFVLCRLFRKPEETVSSVISHESVQSGDSPTTTRSSPVSTPCVADCLEVESLAPLCKISPKSDQHEELRPLPQNISKQSVDSGLADEARHLITYPVKQEESHSNMTSDAGDNNAGGAGQEEGSLYDDLAEFLGPECGHLLSEEYPNFMMLPSADDSASYDVDQGSHAQIHSLEFKYNSVTAMLDAMLGTAESCSADLSTYQINSTTNNAYQGQINQGSHWHSATERGLVDDVDSEPLMEEEKLGQEDPALSRLPFSSTSNFQMGTSKWHNAIHPSMEFQMGMSGEAKASCELETIERVRRANSNENSTSLATAIGTKINIRSRNHENFTSSVDEPSDLLGHQGIAERRIRLQNPEHNVWHICSIQRVPYKHDNDEGVEETEKSEVCAVRDHDLSTSDDDVEETKESEVCAVRDHDLSTSDDGNLLQQYADSTTIRFKKNEYSDGTSSSDWSYSEFSIDRCSLGHEKPTLKSSRQINDGDSNKPESSCLRQELHKVMSLSTRRIGGAVVVLASLICAATVWFLNI